MTRPEPPEFLVDVGELGDEGRVVCKGETVLRRLPCITRLDLAVVTLPDWHPEATRQPTAPVYAYVIDHPGGPILVDTGVGFGNEFVDEVYAPQRQRLDRALGEVGIDAASITAVVNSHLHFDHCGQNPALYGAGVPFIMRAAEIAEVERDRFYTDPEWALPPVEQRRIVDGDVEIADGVTVLSTPGHTPGHQSVLVDAADGRVILAGQVVWELDEFRDERVTVSNAFDDDHHEIALDSIRRLKALRPDAVHFAHCNSHPSPPADGA